MANPAKIKASRGVQVSRLAACANAMVKMANQLYWLHPEIAEQGDFLDYLKQHYPSFDWYLCSRYKQFKILL